MRRNIADESIGHSDQIYPTNDRFVIILTKKKNYCD